MYLRWILCTLAHWSKDATVTLYIKILTAEWHEQTTNVYLQLLPKSPFWPYVILCTPIICILTDSNSMILNLKVFEILEILSKRKCNTAIDGSSFSSFMSFLKHSFSSLNSIYIFLEKTHMALLAVCMHILFSPEECSGDPLSTEIQLQGIQHVIFLKIYFPFFS